MKAKLNLAFLIILCSTAFGQTQNNTIYEIFVRSFYDSNQDGIGDLKGITEKLDYLNDGNSATDTDLEVGIIWLTPMFPSESYHGYDVTDYKNVNADYGTLDDFKTLLKEAHKRGMRVVLDIPFNHTSTKHPWFKAALKNDEKFKEFYFIEKENSNDFWHKDATAGVSYFGLFGGDLPDLNFDNKLVREEVMDVADFWLDMGVDGFRLDAAKHIYGWSFNFDWDDKNKTNSLWNEFTGHVKGKYENKILFGEVLDSDENLAHFAWGLDGLLDPPFMHKVRSFCNGHRVENFGKWWVEYLAKCRNNNESFDLYPFVSSHDENPRLASYMKTEDHKERCKLAMSILLTMPKLPILYYGDELLQEGWKWNGNDKNAERNAGDGSGVWDETLREPLPWYAHSKPNKPGQPQWIENANQKIIEAGSKPAYYNRKPGISVEEQINNEKSTLCFVRSLTNFRAENSDFSDEEITRVIETDNNWISFEKGEYLVLINGNDKEMPFKMKDDLGTYQNSEVVFVSDCYDKSKKDKYLKNAKVLVPEYGLVILKQNGTNLASRKGAK